MSDQHHLSSKSLSICAALALAGCAKPVEHPRTMVVYDEPGPSYYVHDVRLKDGTRCVISTSGRSDGGTGIVCDWEGPKVER